MRRAGRPPPPRLRPPPFIRRQAWDPDSGPMRIFYPISRSDEQWDAVRDSSYISRTVDYTQLLIDANRVENQVLSDEQLRDIHVISNHGEWRQVHTRFMMSALEFGILSVHLFGGKEYKDSEILVFGTATKTLVIKIGDGYTKGDKYGCNPLRYMIPQELAELISNNEVVLIGSDVIICKEMLDLGSGSAYDAHEDTTAMVDFGEFVEAALTDWNLIDMWPNLRGTAIRNPGWIAAKIRTRPAHITDFGAYENAGDYSQAHGLNPEIESPWRRMSVMNQWKVHELQNPHALAFLYGISRTPIDVVLSVVNYKALAPMGMGWNFRGMALAIVVWETVCPVFVNRQTDRAITGLLPGHAPIWRNRGLRRQRGPAQQPQRGTQERRGYQYGFHEDVLQSIEQTPEQLADEQSWYDQRAQGLHPDDEEPSDAESEGEPRASAVQPSQDGSLGAVPRRPAQGTRTATALPPPPTPTLREPLAAAHPMSQDLNAGMTEDSRRDRPWLQGCVKCGSILHGGRFCPVPRKELKCEYCKTTGTHTTRQCQIMQSACLKCGYRGHGGGRCAGNRDIRKDFEKFEAFADEGERSRLRLEPQHVGLRLLVLP
ncbi:unnamed protein product [Sphagnum tenellum]